MFGLGLSEILLVLFLALIFIGPKDLPKIAHRLGRFIRTVKLTLKEIQDTVEKEINVKDK